jgi:coenzyme F420-reducing hydrogenase beta subunit
MPDSDREAPEVYAAWSHDDDLCSQSSSGGVFTELARVIIRDGGYVAGAAFDDNFDVVHILVDDEVGLSKLRQSKYVQSDMGSIYKQIGDKLSGGKTVLFSGTSCQCAGIKHLYKEYSDNLILCDLICHGVNAPKEWRTYLSDKEKEYGARAVSINMRDKHNGWNNFGVAIAFENGREYFSYHKNDSYFAAYLKNQHLRKCCFNCRYKAASRETDITLGDFWGIKDVPPETQRCGISAVLLHSAKGGELFNRAADRITKEHRVVEDVKTKNPMLTESAKTQGGSTMRITADSRLDIGRATLFLTHRCNLKCKLCIARNPYYKEPWYPEYHYLIETIDRFFSVIDNVEILQLEGGETLLRVDLPQILEYLTKYKDRVKREIRIITNGTIVPSDSLLSASKLWDEKIYYIVDNYGDKLSVNAKAASRKLDDWGIRHELRGYSGDDVHFNGWVDLGDFSKKRDVEGAKVLFKKCSNPSKLGLILNITNGEVFTCGRSRLTFEQDIIPKNNYEIVNLFDDNELIDAKRAKIKGFYLLDYFTACQYCNGNCADSPHFTPAEQLGEINE